MEMSMNEFLNWSIYRLTNEWETCLELSRKDHPHSSGAWCLNLHWKILLDSNRVILPSKYLQRKLRRKRERALQMLLLMVKLKLVMSSFLNFYPEEVLEVRLNFSGFRFLFFFYRWSTGQDVPEFLVLPENPARSYHHINPQSGCQV